MKIAIIDYGAGNLKSVKKALAFLDINSVVTNNIKEIDDCSALILPGVGAFPDAMKSLHSCGLAGVIRQQAEKKPLLGICLGMQLLFEKGYEFEECDGLGLIGGTVEKLEFSQDLKIPHMGWNELVYPVPSPLFRDCQPGYVYFVHSFGAKTEEKNVVAYTEYGQRITAAVEKENIFGTQFHPEKSGALGLKMLKNFCDYVKEC